MGLARLRYLPLLVLSLAGFSAGCEGMSSSSSDEDLTSKTARARTITFEGLLYLQPTASEMDVRRAVDAQARTAFGPMHAADLSVATRDVKVLDPAAITRRKVDVVGADGTRTPKLEVRFTYADQALAGPRHDRSSTVSLALLAPGYQADKDRILRECTTNDDHAREFASSLWYVFDPSLSSCRSAIAFEQGKIDAARTALPAPVGDVPQVAEVEAKRLYLPITAKLGADTTNTKTSYPEYQRLFTGGVAKDRVVVGVIQGLVGHGLEGSPSADYGYGEYMAILGELFESHPGFTITKVEPSEDLATFPLSTGNTVTNVRIQDIVSWARTRRFPATLSRSEQTELVDLISRRLYRHWVTIETQVDVAIGGAPARPVTIEVNAYFGAEQDKAPYRRAVKSSDVFLYNGHSYIGAGPLDPTAFARSDLPPSYQLFFINGCVSYNYYHGGFVDIKEGGTQNLDLVSNGLETPAYDSGRAMGRLLARLLDGTNASYGDLLGAASSTDQMRVVDGELDNEFAIDRDAVTLTRR